MSQDKTGSKDISDKMSFQVISPEKVLIDEKDVDIVVFRYASPEVGGGELGVMRHHAPMLVRLPAATPVRYIKDNQTYYLAVAGGFVEVRNNRVTILSTGAERVSDKQELDTAIKARLRAEAWLEEGEKIGKVGFDEKMAEAEVKKEVIHMYKDQSGDTK
ncbi:MAG: F0F1 ATP synthase subunit epsilon [bacterium]